VGPRAGLDKCGKSRPHRDSTPDCPDRSQSLYRLSNPAHLKGTISDCKSLVDATLDVGIQQSLFIRREKKGQPNFSCRGIVVDVNDRKKEMRYFSLELCVFLI
jgi:hypothetical protein